MAVSALSHDTLFDGKLSCAQSVDGYRFSIDAVLLAHFATPRQQDRVLDLGAGCGVISLVMAYRHPSITLTCLEIQESLAKLVAHNITHNGLASRLRMVQGDLRCTKELFEVGSFDLVVCNPPYYGLGSGQQNPADEQAVARHQLKATLDDIAKAAAFALRTKGRLAMIYPAARGASLLATLRAYRLEPKRLRVVYPYPGAEGTLMLVEALKGGGEELAISAPLYIYERPGGDYTPEVQAWYQEHR